MSRESLLQTAFAHHHAGQLDAADAAYAQLIAEHPNDPAVLHAWALLAAQQKNFVAALQRIDQAILGSTHDANLHNMRGRVLAELGRSSDAMAAYQRAIELDSNLADAHNNLAHAASAAGDVERAIAAYARAAELRPSVAMYHTNLGLALGKAARSEEALTAHQRAVAAEPASASAHDQLAVALREAGLLSEAIAEHQRAAQLAPHRAEVHNNHANTLRRCGQLDDAIVAYRRAVAASPAYAAAHSNLAAALAETGQVEPALDAATTALSINPSLPEAHNHHGFALAAAGRFTAAAQAYRRAIALRPDYAEAHSNLAIALLDGSEDASASDATRAAEAAISAARRAVELDPNLGPAHTNLAQILLTLGRFEEGWRENEWRFWSNPHYRLRPFAQPQWRGEPLEHRTLLIHAEQGFGDAIQFIRYAPLIAATHPAARIVVECHRELLDLLAGVPGIMQVVAVDEALPAFDVHCPLLSLPLACGTTLQTLPANVPYLQAREELSQRWAATLGPRRTGDKRIGLVWAGRPTHSNDRRRSMRLSDFAPLAAVENLTLYSLQKGPAAEQAATAPAGLRLIDHTEALTDFTQTAGLISQLDGVIGVDTAVVHLAGAMGRRVWLLLPRAADWRWMRGRNDSPWYPTMRIVRQERWRRWEEAVGALKSQIADAQIPIKSQAPTPNN